MELERYKEAAAEFESMVKEGILVDESRFYLGLALQGESSFDSALEELRKIDSTSAFYKDARVTIVQILEEKNELEQAISTLEAIYEEFPDDSVLCRYLGSLLNQEKRYDKAIEVLEAGRAKDPRNPKLLFTLGVSYDKSKRLDDVIKTMEEVIKLDPENVDAPQLSGIHVRSARDAIG